MGGRAGISRPAGGSWVEKTALAQETVVQGATEMK
jgi:hypothetical protein